MSCRIGPGLLDVGEGHGPRVDGRSALVTSAASAGSSARMSRVGTEPWPLPTICSRAARRAADGIGGVEPATEPISIQVSGWPRSCAAVTIARSASAVG